MTNGTQPTPTQPTGQAPQAPQTSQAPAPKKGSGLKIFLGILGGCLVVLIIVGIVGWILVKKAAKKAGEEFEKASKELEQSFNGLEKAGPSLNEQLKNLENVTPTPSEEETEVAPGP
ncbi:MAG: hypothetical protein AB1465_03290 [Patescibacteria group bacterium]